MPSIPNDTVWNNEDVDDGFLDEDEIEIVSLLDHPDASGSTAAVGQSNNDTNGSNINQGKTTAPRMHPVGLCVIIVLFLLVASMLLSQPSSLSPEIKTPSVITIGENTDASDIVNNDKNNDEEQPLPSPSSLSSSLEIETKNTSSASTSIKNKNENGSHQPPSSSSNDTSNVTQTTTSTPPPPPPKTGKYDGESEEDAIKWFELHTGNSRIDQAYRLAMDELHQNIEHDARDHAYFMTGGTEGGGDRSWTRQTAYAIELGAGIVHPDVSRQSLEACTEVASIFARDKQYSATVWYQDEPIGSEAGGWPKLADAIVGARGAWNLYLYTGNSTMLEWAYELTLRSLLRAESEVLQNDNGKFFVNHLFGGGSFFMASNAGSTTKYWCDYGELNHTKVLSTNILYYNAYHYAYRMGTILMENNQIVKSLKERSKALKKTIRERLWIEEKGLYAYFEDPDGNLGEYTEGLGVALALLSDDFESDHRIKLLFEKVHRTELGIPSMWPWNDRIESYDPSYDDDNGRIWPFVSGYFAIAAARHGYTDIFADEMANLIDLSEKKDPPHKRNTFAEYYESGRGYNRKQLWSDAAYLGMVYKGLFGMDFQEGGIEFSPNKIERKDGILKTNETMSLINMKYRRAILDIHVTGFGTNVTSFKLNGEVQELPKMDAYVTGRQLIEIEVASSKS